MAKLVFSMIESLDGYVGTQQASSTGLSRTSRHTPSSTTSSGRSARICTAVECTR